MDIRTAFGVSCGTCEDRIVGFKEIAVESLLQLLGAVFIGDAFQPHPYRRLQMDSWFLQIYPRHLYHRLRSNHELLPITATL